MVSYRFKRNGKVYEHPHQREEGQDLYDMEQEDFSEGFDHIQDYSGFYDEAYGQYTEDRIQQESSRDREQNIIARTKNLINDTRQDMSDYYNFQVERHKDYYASEDAFWMRRQQQKRNRRFMQQAVIIALVIFAIFGWYWLMSLLR